MGITDNLRKQHKEILEIADRISSCLNPDDLSKDGTLVRDLLSQLAQMLEFHLIKEDDLLYPALLSHPDKTIKLLAKLYINKMGGIRERFNEYMAGWSDATAVQDNPDEFINETREIFDAISRRIDKEDNELYPLLDR